VKKATQAENRLINLCNHNVSSDAKVTALRKHVARAVKLELAKQEPRIVYIPTRIVYVPTGRASGRGLA
jgi:hypothetical protein